MSLFSVILQSGSVIQPDTHIMLLSIPRFINYSKQNVQPSVATSQVLIYHFFV